MYKRFFLSLLCLMTIGLAAAQQKAPVTGHVSDAASGEALIGVSIRVDGTSTGTSSDIDGNFSISAPGNATLIFTYMGYEPVRLNIDNRNTLDVKMNVQAELIEEVVVVGYTSMKKRDVLGAVSKLEGDAITALPVSSAAQAMQGRIAGVSVSNATGAPGAGVSVRVRGVGSISSDNEPLYIVDGIPIEDAMNLISPNDIENITVLKDASSAAVYGSRANNGVVLITTKSGSKGKARISYNGQFGFQTHGHLIPMANAAQYREIYNESVANDNAMGGIQRTPITEEYMQNLADVDYLDAIFRTAPIFVQELSISGGSEKVNYLLSGSYYGQDGIINNSGYDRISVRSNITADVKEWLSVGLNLSAAQANTQYVSSSGDGYGNSEGGSVVRYAMFRNPNIPVRDADGNFVDLPSVYFGNSIYDTFFGDSYNPVALAEYTDRNRRDMLFFGKVNLTFKLPFNIKWTNNFGVDYKGTDYKVFNRSWGYGNRINNPNGIAVEQGRYLNWTFNSVIDYRQSFGEDHNLSALLGFEAIRNNEYFTNESDQNFPVWDKDLLYVGNGLGEKTAYESEYTSTLASFFAQVSYDYKSRYYVSGTLRYDGSSRFVGNNRWGLFYSASAGWNLDQEAFLRDVNWLNKLKLRVGYGAIGNQNVGNYAYSDYYSSNYNYPFSGTSYYGYVQTKLGNPNLKWETSRQFNAGIDFEVLRGELGMSIDYYNKITDDMLVEASYPPSLGNADPNWINSGSVLNEGVDVEIYYRKQWNDASFNVSLNAGWLHNEVLELEAPILGGRVDNGIYATKTEVGYPIGSFYMYEMEGIFQNEAEILTSAYQGADIEPGDVKFVDQNGDGIINDEDRVHLGSAIPVATLGLNIGGTYKGWDLSLFFQGAFGQKIYNQILTDSEGFYRGFNVTERYYENHWTGEGSTNEFPRASWKAKSNNARVSSRFLEDGSYLRLKNIQLGYTFNTKKWGIEMLRLYVAATNLWTITGYSGFDPEMTVSANSTSEGDRASGIDWGTYPAAITYTFGINLTF